MKGVVRYLHMSPEAQEEIERKIGQSLARSRLTKLADLGQTNAAFPAADIDLSDLRRCA